MRFFLLLLLIPLTASAESVFRDPVEFLRKHLMDFWAGPGYIGNENIRAHSTKKSQLITAKHGPAPLYDFRIGPVNISNVYTQSNFTRGRGPRIGLLFNYTGDAYSAEGIAPRRESLFGGGFIGWNFFTYYAITDLLGRRAGAIHTLRFAPSLFKVAGNEFFAIFEAEHMNRLYVDYYFGIRPFEATPVLTTYDGKRTMNYSGTLLYVYHISKGAQFLLWGGQKRYGRGIADSPTVGIDNAYQAGIGWIFRII